MCGEKIPDRISHSYVTHLGLLFTISQMLRVSYLHFVGKRLHKVHCYMTIRICLVHFYLGIDLKNAFSTSYQAGL